jgi:hypothetical protein
MKKHFLLLVIITCSFAGVKAQDADSDTYKNIANETNTKKTANSKDILTTFFRASIDNLLGTDRRFTFNATLYGIDSLFRKNRPLSYNKERWLRQNSIDIGITGDSSNRITKFSFGATLSLINKKDIKNNRLGDKDIKTLESMAVLMQTIHRSVQDYIAQNHPEEFAADSINRAIEASWNAADRANNLDSLHPFITEALRDTALTGSVFRKLKAGNEYITAEELDTDIKKMLTGVDIFHETYQQTTQKYARKPLWTLSPSATYDRIKKQGEYTLGTALTFGLGKNYTTKPWEFEARGLFQVLNDSTILKSNYRNKPLSVSVGINKVMLANSDQAPKMEFKLFTQYDHQFGDVLPGTDKSVFSFNTTLRVNIFQSLWLPITVKYDPENGNFLGFFSIVANLGN